MIRILSFFKNYWPALLSGVLMGTSYIPLPPWAILFCFAPLWVLVLQNSSSWKSAFFAGWWTQFVLSLIGFYWVAYVSHEFGYLPWAVSVLVLILFAATVHTYFAVAAAAGWWIHRRMKVPLGPSLFMMVALVSLSEVWWPSLFPWNLGYTLLGVKSPLAQWADVVGFWGLSLGLHLINALIAYLWIRRDRLMAGISLGIVTLVLAALFLGGVHHQQKWLNVDQSLQVLQIQANIGNLEKYYAERGAGFEQSITDQYTNLTREALLKFPQTEIVVWPESAFPDFLDPWTKNRKYSRQLFDFVQKSGKPLLTGGYSSDPLETVGRKEYNGLFLIGENGEPLTPAYHKTYLLAFGEYTPGTELFPWLAKYSPAGTGFGRGSGPTVIPFKGTTLGLQICYESLYPEFTATLVKNGAQILVNLTNDSWFGPGSEPFQHMYMTLGRAIEARRPLIRSTNTGISTVALASGEILQNSPMFKPWSGLYSVGYRNDKDLSFYVEYGAVLPWLLFAIVLALLSYFAVKGSRREKSERP
jgi:apolipoprotein N-acyltransferase